MVYPGMAIGVFPESRIVGHSPEVCPVIIAGKTDSKPCCGGCARPFAREFSPCGQRGDLI